MGIYIPNEPMPKNCAFCPVEHYDCPLLGEDEKGWGIDVTAYFDGNERHPDCPLVEVKAPHGDLIDRDALKHWILTEMACLDTEEDRVFVADRMASELPTIIEADSTQFNNFNALDVLESEEEDEKEM